jgi:hypothetical protein
MFDKQSEQVSERRIPREPQKAYVPERRRTTYKDQFKGRLAAVVTKTYIWISPLVTEALGSSYASLTNGKTTWMIRAAAANEPGAYLLDEQNKNPKSIIRAPGFIAQIGLPAGYFFFGEAEGHALYFSKTPDGKI